MICNDLYHYKVLFFIEYSDSLEFMYYIVCFFIDIKQANKQMNIQQWTKKTLTSLKKCVFFNYINK